MSRVNGRLVPILLAGGVACGGGAVGIPQGDVITKVVATDAQSGIQGTRLPLALAARLSFADGMEAPRTEVVWTIVEGSGAWISDTLSVADGLGRAEISLGLGGVGTYRIRAAINVDRSRSVEFTATALPGPSITDVQPPSFAGYDTVTVRGVGLYVGTYIEVGGVPAWTFEPPWTLGGPPGMLQATVPGCLPAGSVDVVAVLGDARSNAIPTTYTSSTDSIRLEVGEFRVFTAGELSGCAMFPGTGAGEQAEYLLAAQSAGITGGSAIDFRLNGFLPGVPAPPPAEIVDPELPFAVQFHDWLRERDAEHGGMPKPLVPPTPPRAAPAGVSVGTERRFRVCSKLECQAIEDFPEVRAEAKYVGEHAIIYVDNASPAGGLNDTDLNALGELFDQDLYPTATSAFGSESDIDGNGRAIILLTPVVNGLTPRQQCSTAIITGFFFSIDLDPIFEGDARSNEGEVFYAVTADPSGSQGCPLPASKIRQIVPVTFIHEFQHMISYHQHVLVRGGEIEETWLNEGMSHLAEELGGRRLLAAGDADAFSRFVTGSLTNGYRYLENPLGSELLISGGPGTLAERGAGWLFVRWLADQYGDGAVRLLSESDRVGTQNIEAATGETWERLVTRWFMANFVSDYPGLTVPPFLEYSSWDLRATYAALNTNDPGQFPRVFPLAPFVSIGGAFVRQGSLPTGSGDYVIVQLNANSDGFEVAFTGPGGGPFSSGTPRLSVVRIR